jgi:hypothetical protein
MIQSKFIPLYDDSVFPKETRARQAAVKKVLTDAPVELGRSIPGLAGRQKIFQIDIDDVVYNFHNYRFFLERATIEWQRGNSFYTDEQHRHEAARITEEKIWNQDEAENEDVIKSLLEDGQYDPAVCDLNGVIVSGNRRLTLLHQIKRRKDAGLYKNQPISQEVFEELSKIRVAIIEDELSESEIVKLETKLQHNNPKKLEYDRIAKYFIVKNLKDNEHLSDEDIYKMNRSMQSLNSSKDVKKFVDVANLMESYLKFFKVDGDLRELTGLEDPMRRLDDELSKIKNGEKNRLGNRDLMWLEYRNTFFIALMAHKSNPTSQLKEKWYRSLYKAFDNAGSSGWKALTKETEKVQRGIEAPEKIDDTSLKEARQKWSEEHAENITESIEQVVDEVRDFERFQEKPEKLLSRAFGDLEQFDKMLSSPDKEHYLSNVVDPHDTVNDLYRKLDSILNKLPTE